MQLQLGQQIEYRLPIISDIDTHVVIVGTVHKITGGEDAGFVGLYLVDVTRDGAEAPAVSLLTKVTDLEHRITVLSEITPPAPLEPGWYVAPSGTSYLVNSIGEVHRWGRRWPVLTAVDPIHGRQMAEPLWLSLDTHIRADVTHLLRGAYASFAPAGR